jgi:hypothetical protein
VHRAAQAIRIARNIFDEAKVRRGRRGFPVDREGVVRQPTQSTRLIEVE